ncbi:hypothetical protein, partial [Microvirga roseola]|uniref:hypothetical protein n=1 Tax=Microvirga roseola TaxID=2883126 RepID=UPI001E5F1E06
TSQTENAVQPNRATSGHGPPRLRAILIPSSADRRQHSVSETTAQKIDSEAPHLVEAELNDARRILTDKAQKIEALTRGLLDARRSRATNFKRFS